MAEPELVATNLCVNPSLETDANGWRVADGSGWNTQVGPVAYSGSQGLVASNSRDVVSHLRAEFDWDTRRPTTDWNIPFEDGAVPPIVPGATYTFSVWVKPETIPRNTHILLTWEEAGTGEQIRDQMSATVLESDTDWTRIVFTTQAPATEQARCWVFIDWWDPALGDFGNPELVGPGGIEPGETHYVDALLIEQIDSVSDYFDGDTPDTDSDTYMWEGVPHASVSHRLIVRIDQPPVPPAGVCPWPIDQGCLGSAWEDLDPAIQERSIALASATLHRLTGYRVGGCPVTVRPCRASCTDTLVMPSFWSMNGWMNPSVVNGTWINSCGCRTDCECAPMCEVRLPTPVGEVLSVKVDGAEVTDWTVYGNALVWTGTGDCPWPLCQDLTLPDTEPGTFSVTYRNSWPIDALGAYAAGILANEFGQACTGGKCRIPANVTALTRQGVSFDIAAGSFPGGMTGIREVDAFIGLWNPRGLVDQPRVWSPDLHPPRVVR